MSGNWWDSLTDAVGQAGQATDNFLNNWGKDRLEDAGTSIGIRTPGNYRDPYIRAQEAAKNGDLDTLQGALQQTGPGNNSEEMRTIAGLREQAKGMASQRADQAFNKQANQLYGDNGLITGIETRRAAQQLASQQILGQMQSKSQLASQALQNKGLMDQASLQAMAGLKQQDVAGQWGFKNTDLSTARNLDASLANTQATREANLLANQTQRQGQLLNTYASNFGTVAGALSNSISRSSFK